MSFAEFHSCHLLVGIVLALCFNQVSSTTNETDRLTLLAFKADITGDPFGVLNSWNNSIGFCQWYGITCGCKHRRVTVLKLRSQGLSGSISPHIGNLSFLREMLLQNNTSVKKSLQNLKKANEPISSSINDSRPNVLYGALVKATDGFSLTNLIGVVSFGHVYRGILEDNGIVVAVKVLHLVHCGALKSFMVECKTLKNIKHRNLLKILSVCSGSDYQGNDFKALVYQFMDNGGLERSLHPITISHGNELPKKLNFILRLNIAIGVASALDYLHHQCHIPIVHCDLKPINILLDAKMVAHVGDFGLAKFFLGSSLDTIVNQMSSMGLRGTIGYAPPEYAMECRVSRDRDVYSYGILLLELFTSLSPTDNIFRDNLTLHSFVAKALLGRVLEITDGVLLQERESHLGPCSPQQMLFESDGRFQECLVMVFNIGVACSYSMPGRWMSISGIANQLQQIREKLFALGLHGEDDLLTASV
ncbi:putative receptor-like protein kinase At3g47110 [Syzygium oleosum]|uniref:putative receptor-like protein kinase At3g47110 n=1 Tax=Syzygium oleosum TaxID=219896 RepID=UPI0024B96F87|nr:putative receptor-like protein kinase At3g47110 [Syzygium oleosum]